MHETPFSYKLRHLVLPMLAAIALFTTGYSALNWYFVARDGLLPVDASVADIWLPLFIALVLVATFIRPRVHALVLDEKRNIPFLYGVIALAVIALPLLAAQQYVHRAAGQLVHLRDAAAIASAPRAKYYSADRICLDKPRSAAFPTVSVTGDNDENLDVELYVAVPLCDRRGTAPAWMGFTYDTTIDNDLSDTEKDARYRVFVQETERKLRLEDTRRYRYLERLGSSGERRGFEKALRRSGAKAATPLLLVPHTDAFQGRGDRMLGLFILALLASVAGWSIAIAIPYLKPEAERHTDPPHWVRGLLVPTSESYGLPLLIDANVAVFLAMVLSGLGVLAFQTDDLARWGASSGALDRGFGLVRLITCQFVHAGVMHLLGNLYGLLFAGALLAPVAKNGRLILCYLLTGLGGSLASVTRHPETLSVGASGAIFGLFGILLSLLLLRDPRLQRQHGAVLINAGIFVALNLLYGATTPGIDNWAHIGGLTAVLIVGAALRTLDRDTALAAAPAP